jgi:uncharacterized membrane protein
MMDDDTSPAPLVSDTGSTTAQNLEPKARVENALAHLLPTLVRIGFQAIWIAFALPLTFLLALIEDRHALVFRNHLSVAARNLTLAAMVALVGLSIGVGAAYLLVRPSDKKVKRLARVMHAALPLCWLWPIPLFLDWRVFEGHGLVRGFLAAGWGIGLEHALRATLSIVPGLPKPSRFRARFANLASAVLVVGLVVWFVHFGWTYSIIEHRRLGTAGFDLGLFDNVMFNLARGEWFMATVDAGNANGGNHLQYHANFLAYLFLPAYLISPGSEILLIIQAVVVGLAAIPFYLLATRKLGSPWFGAAFAYFFLIHEGVQSPVFFEFHFLTLSPFFVGWVLYLFDRGAKIPLLVMWILTLLLREDQGCILAGAALVCLMRGERPWWSLVGGVVGVAWLAMMRFWIMPLNGASGGFHQHSGIFQAMIAPGSHGFGGVLKTLATNPPFSLENLLEGRKFEYVLALAAPFLLLPFRKRLLWILFLPASLFTLVTTNYTPSVSTRFQYSMYWVSMLIFGCLLLLGDWYKLPSTRKRITAAVLSMLVVGTALSYDGGGLFQKHTLVGGFRRIGFTLTRAELERYEELVRLVKTIPPNATVSATESVVPHVSTRRIIRTMRQGAADSEYLLIWKDEVRGGEQAATFQKALQDGRWGVVTVTKNFQLWKMGADTSSNRSAARSVGLRG